MGKRSHVIGRAVGLWIAAAGSVSGPAWGTIYSWTGVNLGKAFNNTSNWNPGGVPGISDRAVIGLADTVFFANSPTTQSGIIYGGNFSSGISVFMSESTEQTWNLQSFTVSDKGSVTLNGPDITASLVASIESTGTILINNASKLTAQTISTIPAANGNFQQSGTLNVSTGGAFQCTLSLELGGGTPVKGGHGFANIAGTGTVSGEVDLADSGTNNIGFLSITSGGLVTQTAGTTMGALHLATQNNTIGNVATLSISGTGSRFRALGFPTLVGSGSASGGHGTLLVSSGGVFEGSAALNINQQGTAIVTGGTLTGMTAISVVGGNLVYNSGTITPSVSIVVSNNGTFTATNTFEVPLG
ncbi:MAG TPA: hypothetical protein VH518_03360, partial [Tepidisphaeraceae bacterium]